MPAHPSRRAVVAAAWVIPASLATGCTASHPEPSPGDTARPRTTTPEPPANPDAGLLDTALAANAEIVGMYEATMRHHPRLREALRPLLAAHREHAVILGDAAPRQDAGPSASTSAPSGGGARQRGSPRPSVPGRPAAAVRSLRAREKELAEACLRRTRRARSGEFARLLASMAACSAQHRHVLGGVSAS